MCIYTFMCIYTSIYIYIYITGVPGAMVKDPFVGRCDHQRGTGLRRARVCPTAGVISSAGGPSVCQGLLNCGTLHECFRFVAGELRILGENRKNVSTNEFRFEGGRSQFEL